VSWQEELRTLDEELATGRLSADEYRVRRDNIMSTAAGTSTPAPTPPPAAPTSHSEQTQAFRPVAAPGPMAPPPSGDNADKTQVVNISESDRTQVVSGGDRTQAVGGWQAARPNMGDAERTQVVPGVPGQQVYQGGHPPRPAPNPYAQPDPWAQHHQQEDMSSPWAGAEFPPMAASGSPDWVRQGPEVFDDSSGGSKKGLIIGLVVLLLAGLAVGGFFLFKPKGGTENPPTAQSTSEQPPEPTTTTKPRPTDPNVALFEDMPAPPASQEQLGEVAEVAKLVELQLIDQQEAALLTAAGVTKVPWKSAIRKAPEDGPTADKLNALVIPTKSEEDAQKLLLDLRAYQETLGLIFIPEPLPNMPPSVIFEKKVVAEQAMYRGLYVSGTSVVRITTIQAPLTNEASLSGTYRNHTEAMMRVFPAA
jgi:hypothetical protein